MTATSGIRIEDGGVSLGRSFGARRLKALLLLSQHPELDDEGWTGRVELHFGPRQIVKAAIYARALNIVPTEIELAA